MTDITKLIVFMEKLIKAEEEWNSHAFKLSKEENFHENFDGENSVVHDSIYRLINELYENENEQLSKAKEGIRALKDFYDAVTDNHKERAYRIFSIGLDYSKRLDVDKIMLMHTKNEKKRKADSVYRRIMGFVKSLDSKLSKEQIKAVLDNKDIDEASAWDIEEKLNQEIEKYKSKYGEDPMFETNPELKEIRSDFPLISCARVYTCIVCEDKDYKDYCMQHDEKLHRIIGSTDQIAKLKADKYLAQFDFPETYKGDLTAITGESRTIKEYNFEKQTA